MGQLLLISQGVLSGATLVVVAAAVWRDHAGRRGAARAAEALAATLARQLGDLLERSAERTERTLRGETALIRREATDAARMGRDELAARLDATRQQLSGDAQAGRVETADAFAAMARALKAELAAFAVQFEQRSEGLRQTVDRQLAQMMADNGAKLEAMRTTVAEKLEVTLERRLGASFKLVSERLEQVHKGLGEMQTLAVGVGDLKKVMSNVKTRGTWGEIQLGSLLEQVLSPEQFDRNVQTKPESGGRVEFAIKMPNRGIDGGSVWLPIDAKFPLENYHRLVEAQEQADPAAAELESRALESFIKAAAKDISDKYIGPPLTTDFAVMYLPTEGLFAEVARRLGLVEYIQRECRVIVAGPTTLAALLNSLQMGFRTLAIQQRSSEVWEVLGAVKTEFAKFDGVLKKVEKKLQEAGNVIEGAQSRSRVITRKLKTVQELAPEEASKLLALAEAAPDAVDLDELDA